MRFKMEKLELCRDSFTAIQDFGPSKQEKMDSFAECLTPIITLEEGTPKQRFLLENFNDREPIDYFLTIASEDILSEMLAATNENLDFWLYRCPDLEVNENTEKITMLELKTFLGLLLHMGTIQLNRIVDYWRPDPLFSIAGFHVFMSRNRFMIILKILQFTLDHEITSFIDSFNLTMKKVYVPGKDLVLRAPLVYSEGCLKRKSDNAEYYLNTLTDSAGVTLRATVSKETESVAQDILMNILDKGHSVYISPSYLTEEVARYLTKRMTHVTGLMRCITRGSGSIQSTDLAGGLSISKLQPKPQLSFLTSKNSGPENIETELEKYKNLMKDEQGDVSAFYSCERRPMMVHKKVGIHLIQLMLINSFYICQMNSTGHPKLTLYDFRLAVIEKLLTKKLNPSTRHFPARFHVDERGRTRRKKCRVCYQKGRRRDTLHFCPSCPQSPGLCLNECFLTYHQSLPSEVGPG